MKQLNMTPEDAEAVFRDLIGCGCGSSDDEGGLLPCGGECDSDSAYQIHTYRGGCLLSDRAALLIALAKLIPDAEA